MFSRHIKMLLPLCTLCACVTDGIPQDALRLQESTLDIRSIQTRTFVAPSSNDILAATIATFQDMEFNIDRIEKSLGVITASKISDADSTSEKAVLFVADIMCAFFAGGCGLSSGAKDEQHITATLVVLPSLARSDEFVARITIQRVIYDKSERIAVLERIEDAEIYQQAFDKLSKAMYIQVSEND